MARIERQIADRLAQLISEAENPRAEMLAVSKQLLDADLANYRPALKESPREFAANVIEENPLMLETLAGHRAYLNDMNLPEFETAEQLINSLLPASSE